MITKEYLQQELRRRIDGIKRGVETTTDLTIGEMKSILVLVDALNDYEKKYNEALERAKAYHRNELAGTRQEMTEYIFPELRKSEDEDERIRKALIQFLNDIKSISESGRTSWAVRKEDAEMCNGFLTYLEKQKEQKPVVCDEDKNLIEKFYAEIERLRELNAPEENDSDTEEIAGQGYDDCLDDMENFLNKIQDPIPFGLKEECKDCQFNYAGKCKGYCSLKRKQKPAEWSEEDERMRNQLIYDVEHYKKAALISAKQQKATKALYDGIEKCYDEKIAWLKSLRPKSKEELAKMLQDEYNKGKEEGERIGHTKGYNKGYKDAEEAYNKAVSYHP